MTGRVTADPVGGGRLLAGVGGVDEAGRGPLAGPVVAAAVILAPGQSIDGVTDSKRLTATMRERLVIDIEREALACATASASVAEIDAFNILQATLLAMRRAVARLAIEPAVWRIDGNRAPPLPDFAGRIETWVRGDALCMAIGAASILAKVYRDRAMQELDARYPAYGFARHKGYPTAEHRALLQRYGPCAAHRRSFRPVRLAAGEVPA